MQRIMISIFLCCVFSTVLFGQVQFDIGTKLNFSSALVDAELTHADNNTSLDIVYGRNYEYVIGSTPSFILEYWSNDGSGNFNTSATVIQNFADGITGLEYDLQDIAAGHFDNDDRRDIAIIYEEFDTNTSTTKNLLQIYRYTSSGFVSQQIIELPSGNMKMMATGNINGIAGNVEERGDLAILINDKIYVFENHGDIGPLNEIRLGEFNQQTQVYDPSYTIDNSLQDLQHNFFNVYGLGFVNFETRPTPLFFYDDLVILDDDPNGSSGETESRFVDNNINAGLSFDWNECGFEDNEESLNGLYNQYVSVFGADIDGDGVEDVISDGGVRDGVTKNYVWTGDAASPEEFDKSVVAYDFDHDNKLDILGGYRWSFQATKGSPATNATEPGVFFNDGSNDYPDETLDISFSTSTLAGGTSNHWFHVGDIQGTGSAAILSFNGNPDISFTVGEVVVYKRTDNIAPAPPTNPSVEDYQGHPKITWNSCPDLDFDFYIVYKRKDSPNWVAIDTTTTPSFVDYAEAIVTGPAIANETIAHYKMTACDVSAQESDYSTTVTARVQGPAGYKVAAPPKDTEKPVIASDYQLLQNYPNPFNPSTLIKFSIPEDENVNLAIFNVRGQLIKTLVNGFLTAGDHSITWYGTDKSNAHVAPGIYFYRLQSDSYALIKKMVYIE